MKKGERYSTVRGRHIFLTLLTLILTTSLLRAGEKNATLLSPENRFPILISSSSSPHSSDASSVSPNYKDKCEKENFGSNTAKEELERSDHQGINLSTLPTAQWNGSKGDDVTSSNAQVCNYGKGRWVLDNKPPLYSGSKCKRWLSGMWACRLTRRKDFSYEGYQWHPKNCDMPEFERTAFLERMRGKTIAFIGDSIGRQQFQSLMCMVSGGEDSTEVEDVGMKYDLVKLPGAIRSNGYAYQFKTTNTTILYYWSSTLADLEPINKTDRQTKIAMHLDRPPSFMTKFIDRFDVLVLNTGHHWNKGKFKANRWVVYVDGKPKEDKSLARISNARNFTIHSIVKWVDSQIPSHSRLKAFFRTISPRHFFNGEWNSGGNCDNTIPLTRGSEVVQDGSSDRVVQGAVSGTRVKILDVTALSKLRDEAHISRYSIKATQGINDCLHWCLPGIPDTWNEILAAQV